MEYYIDSIAINAACYIKLVKIKVNDKVTLRIKC